MYFVPYKQTQNCSSPQTTASSSSSPIEYFFLAMFNCLPPNAVGLVCPVSCTCQSLTPRRILLAIVSTRFLNLLRSVPDLVFGLHPFYLMKLLNDFILQDCFLFIRIFSVSVHLMFQSFRWFHEKFQFFAGPVKGFF